MSESTAIARVVAAAIIAAPTYVDKVSLPPGVKTISIKDVISLLTSIGIEQLKKHEVIE